MGQYVLLHPNGNSKLRALLRGKFCHRLFLCVSRADLFSFLVSVMIKLCRFVLPISRISDPNFTLGRPRLLCWIGNIPATENSCKCNRANSFWPKSPYVFGTGLTIFGCGPSSHYTKSNFWALEQALIQLWQPRRNIPFITNSSIAGKALSKEHRFRPRDSLEPFRCGGNCAGHPPQIPSDKPFAAALSTTE